MNSKELLEQASSRIERMNELMASIDSIECTLLAATDPEAMIAFFQPKLGSIGIRYILTDDVMESIKSTTLKEVQKVRDEKSAELEQLLGIQPVPEKRKPATINPEFEAAFQGMIQSNKNPADKLQKDTEQLAKEVPADPLEEKLAGIIQKQEQEIKAAPPEDKSLDKYPTKTDKRSKYPENMTEESVSRLYRDEGKSMAEIATYFGVKTSTVNNFIYLHKLSRKKADKPEKKPDEKERP